MRLAIRGILTTDVVAPTIRFRVKFGSTVVGDTAAVTLPILATAGVFDMDFLLTFATTGAASTYTASGRILLSAAPAIGVLTTCDIVYVVPSVTPVDLTVDKAIDVTVQWGTANASNSIASYIAVIETTAV